MVGNNRGGLTLDFIFALVLVTGLSGLLLAIGLTLAMVEASQYIAFATSRVYFGGHADPETQAALAEAKFIKLTSIKSFKTLFSNGWFELKDNPQRDFRSEYPDTPEAGNTFVGARLLFNAKMLDFRIPFFGSTGGDGKGFKANITSFLGREPTFQECMQFMEGRIERIKNLSGANWSELGSAQDWVISTDNGC
ncbi:MAG: hypothetical protein ABL958_02765 [Bdellovibrionia bacterium]